MWAYPSQYQDNPGRTWQRNTGRRGYSDHGTRPRRSFRKEDDKQHASSDFDPKNFFFSPMYSICLRFFKHKSNGLFKFALNLLLLFFWIWDHIVIWESVNNVLKISWDHGALRVFQWNYNNSSFLGWNKNKNSCFQNVVLFSFFAGKQQSLAQKSAIFQKASFDLYTRSKRVKLWTKKVFPINELKVKETRKKKVEGVSVRQVVIFMI